MRTAWIVAIVAIFLTAPSPRSQTPTAATVTARPLAADQLAIYQDFLSHYEQYDQLSNLLGMQPVTVPFKIDTPFGIERSVSGPKGCLHNLKLQPRSGEVHRLPPEIMQFGAPESVTRRIAAAGKLLPQSKRSKGTGPDGWVLTKFTLSEIAFDVTHHYAVFTFSADCNCRGGQGGTILYELHGRKWTESKIFCDAWEG